MIAFHDSGNQKQHVQAAQIEKIELPRKIILLSAISAVGQPSLKCQPSP